MATIVGATSIFRSMRVIEAGAKENLLIRLRFRKVILINYL